MWQEEKHAINPLWSHNHESEWKYAPMTSSSSSFLLTASPPSTSLLHRRSSKLHHRFPLLFSNSSRTQVSIETSEADKLVDKIDFGELCNDFECTSSPQVESTARQLARDILELREGNRAFACYAVSVRYKDPIRSFTGHEKYKRPMWITSALENPTVTIQEMVMLSTSLLRIRWTVKGKPKSLLASSVSGDLMIKVKSEFTLNQISGQVIEHQESWDLSSSSPTAQAYFWTSRRLFAASESAKDLLYVTKDVTANFTTPKEDTDIYRDPTDPNKFFQRDDSFERDVYQVALFLALVYFVVQFLRNTI